MCNRQSYEKWKHFRHQHPKFRKWAKHHHRSSFPPVNVQELDDRYELHLFAPGLSKEDFKLSLVDRQLTISTEAKTAETAEDVRWKRREYRLNGIRRQFELNDRIDAAAIEATYQEGVLVVSLPKLEGQETQRQEITVE